MCVSKSARLIMMGGGAWWGAEVCVSNSIGLAYSWKGVYVSNSS